MLQCVRCGSFNVKDEYVKGWSGGTEKVCMMCGRKEFKEVEMPGTKKKCKFEGCEKIGGVKGYCYAHYHEVFGKPYAPGGHKTVNKELREVKMEKLGEEIKRPASGQEVIEVYDQMAARVDDKAKIASIERAAKREFIILQISFQGHEDLRKALEINAKNDMRTPEMQVLWILKCLLLKGEKEAA